MRNITYSKKITIKGKILKEDDILRIANLIHEQVQPDDYEEEYNILFDDQSCITGKRSIDVFKSDEFRRRRSERIWFTYRSKGFEKKVEICLYNSLLSPVESTVEITSTDKEWYNSTCNEILTIISEVENQKIKIPYGAKYVGTTIISLVETAIFSYSLERLFPNAFTKSQSNAIVFLCYAILLGVDLWLVELIEKAYPNVEFSFGPVYLNKSQKIRNSLGIFVPFVIDLILFGLGFIG